MIRRLLAQQGLAILAIVLVLSGGAYAAGQLPKNSVKAFQIAPNAVGASELAPNAVAGGDVRNGSIGRLDLAPAVRPVPSVQQFAASEYGATCTDDDQNGQACVTLNIKLHALSTLTIQARSNWGSASLDDPAGTNSTNDLATGTGGNCLIRIDGNALPDSITRVGEVVSGGGTPVAKGADGFYSGVMVTSAFVTDSAARNHKVELFCTETDGDIDWSRAAMSVVAVPET